MNAKKLISCLGLLSLLLLSGCASQRPEYRPAGWERPETEFQFSQVFFRYMTDEDFRRLDEYFRGEEVVGRRHIVRSSPEVRDGYYFTLRTRPDWRKLPEGATLVMDVVHPDGVRPVEYTFALDETIRSWRGEIFFGLTGEQWPGGRGEPIAWKLRILGPENELLAVEESFLWSDARAD